MFVLLWQFLPFHMLLYQAAAKQIPASLYEAAEIDGASPLQRFWRITVPQLRHTIIASSVLMIVGSMTYFETVLLLTGGGPGTATRILPLHMYLKGFSAFEMGYASAIAVLLVAVGTGCRCWWCGSAATADDQRARRSLTTSTITARPAGEQENRSRLPAPPSALRRAPAAGE